MGQAKEIKILALIATVNVIYDVTLSKVFLNLFVTLVNIHINSTICDKSMLHLTRRHIV